MKRLLIFGSNGFLGFNMVKYFLKGGYSVTGVDLGDKSVADGIDYIKCDALDGHSVESVFSEVSPELVINTIALVDLDLCEADTKMAYAVNVLTAENIAVSASRQKVRLVHISTDHLFDGKKSFCTEEDTPGPVNMYGETKLAAEKKCLEANGNTVAVRTNFFGWSHEGHKKTSAEWMYDQLKNKKEMKLFTDYYFTPIEITYLLEAVDLVQASGYTGVINIAGAEKCSKYEYGMQMADVFGFSADCITKSSIDESDLKTRRQRDLSLSVDKYRSIFKKNLPGIREGLKRFKETVSESADNEKI